MLLGGNIALEGFDSLEPAALVVVKKMVGSETRKISNKEISFEKLEVRLVCNESSSCEVAITLVLQDNQVEASAKEPNLFFAIDSVFKKLSSSLTP